VYPDALRVFVFLQLDTIPSTFHRIQLPFRAALKACMLGVSPWLTGNALEEIAVRYESVDFFLDPLDPQQKLEAHVQEIHALGGAPHQCVIYHPASEFVSGPQMDQQQASVVECLLHLRF
jgi:hypothetical protein